MTVFDLADVTTPFFGAASAQEVALFFDRHSAFNAGYCCEQSFLFTLFLNE